MELHLTNSRGRDTVVGIASVTPSKVIRQVNDRGELLKTVRILRAPLDRAGPFSAQELIDGDPEIDIEHTGKALTETSRVYIDPDNKIAHSVTEWELVYNPDGSLRERRPAKHTAPNIGPDVPLKWSGKLIKRGDAVLRFVFGRKVQITHHDGLSYDFLFGIAKELEEADSLLIVGTGPKSNQPLIFQRNGTPLRGFLEGRTDGNKYCLLLHLSNLEIKAPPKIPDAVAPVKEGGVA